MFYKKQILFAKKDLSVQRWAGARLQKKELWWYMCRLVAGQDAICQKATQLVWPSLFREVPEAGKIGISKNAEKVTGI